MRVLIALMILTLSGTARAGLRGELYLGTVVSGTSSQDETGSPDAEHAGTFHGDVQGGLKFGLITNVIQLGVVGEYATRTTNVERKPDGGPSATYGVQFARSIAGGYLALPIMENFVRFHFEYYPIARAAVSSADEIAANPFHKSDSLTGSGAAAGFGLMWPRANVTVLYRLFTYTKADLNGTETDLPSSQYGPLKTTEISLSVGLMY